MEGVCGGGGMDGGGVEDGPGVVLGFSSHLEGTLELSTHESHMAAVEQPLLAKEKSNKEWRLSEQGHNGVCDILG